MDQVEIKKIVLSGWNPRESFDEEQLQELAQSIKEHGIIEPLIVRPGKKKGTYELVAGERRLRAAKTAKLTKVPVIVMELNDRAAKEIMLLENLQREDLRPMEEAKAIKMLLDDGITQEGLAGKIGKSQPWIANRLRLLTAPEWMQTLLIRREITVKHVILMLRFEKMKFMKTVKQDVIQHVNNWGAITVSKMQRMIDHTVTSYEYCGTVTLNLDYPGYRDFNKHYSFSDVMKKLDKKECKACPDSYTASPHVDRKILVCLNTKCWKKKLNDIATKLHAKEKKAAEARKEKKYRVSVEDVKTGKKRLRDLDSEQYEPIERWFGSHFIESCKTCPEYVIDSEKNKGCVAPECYRKKALAENKEEKAILRDDRKRVDTAVDKFLECLNVKENVHYKFMIEHIPEPLDTNAFKRAMKRFGDVKSVEDAYKVHKGLKGPDVVRAAYALLVEHYLNMWHVKQWIKNVKEEFPGLKPYIPKKTIRAGSAAKAILRPDQAEKPAKKSKSKGPSATSPRGHALQELKDKHIAANGLDYGINENDVYTEPEVFAVKGSTKKLQLSLKLAQTEEGKWTVGHDVTSYNASNSSPAMRNKAIFSTRDEAIFAGLEDMADCLNGHDASGRTLKIVDELIDDYHFKVKEEPDKDDEDHQDLKLDEKEFVELHPNAGWILNNSADDINYKTNIPGLTDVELEYCIAHEKRKAGLSQLLVEQKKREMKKERAAAAAIDKQIPKWASKEPKWVQKEMKELLGRKGQRRICDHCGDREADHGACFEEGDLLKGAGLKGKKHVQYPFGEDGVVIQDPALYLCEVCYVDIKSSGKMSDKSCKKKGG